MLQPQPLSGSSRHICVSFLPALHSSATQSLEQSLFTDGGKVIKSCLTLCNPMD